LGAAVRTRPAGVVRARSAAAAGASFFGTVTWTTRYAAHPRRESPALAGAEGASPPANLSGPDTAAIRQLWKAARPAALTDGASDSSRKLSGHVTEREGHPAPRGAAPCPRPPRPRRPRPRPPPPRPPSPTVISARAPPTPARCSSP